MGTVVGVWRGGVVAVAAAIGVGVAAGPAGAGGWWSTIEIEPRWVAVGDGGEVTATSQMLFASAAEALESRENELYHAYLLPDFDRAALEEAMLETGPRGGAWWSPPPSPIHLAPVSVSRVDANLAMVTASFEMPEVDAGRYALMFCTLDCREPMGDVVPLEDVEVVADVRTAQLLRGISAESDLLVQESWALGERVGEVSGDVAELRATVRTLTREADAQRKAASAEAGKEDAAATVPVAAARSSDPWAAGGWVVAAILALALVRRRPPRDLEPDPGPAPERDRDDAPSATAPPEFVQVSRSP